MFVTRRHSYFVVVPAYDRQVNILGINSTAVRGAHFTRDRSTTTPTRNALSMGVLQNSRVFPYREDCRDLFVPGRHRDELFDAKIVGDGDNLPVNVNQTSSAQFTVPSN